MSGMSGDRDPKRPGGTGSRKKLKPVPFTEDEPVTEPDTDARSTFRPNPKTKRTRSKTGAGDGVPLETVPLKGPTWWERIFFGRVTSGQLAAFCRQFAAYLNAGVDIGKALTSLRGQFGMTALGPVIDRMATGVRRGETLADVCAREPQAFDALFQSMMKVAEARGGVPEMLRNLGRHYEARQSLIRQARAAMIYPVMVVIVASFVVMLLSFWLLPMFADMLKDIAGRNAQLPFASRALMAFSAFTQSYGWFVFPLVMIGTPFFLIRAYKTPVGRRVLDRTLLMTPVFGNLFRTIDYARFTRTLSTLLDAGVDMGSSLDLTAEVMRLTPLQTAVLDSRALVIHGTELSEALATTNEFSPQVIAVVNSGEETGKLPETLNHLADDFEEQVEYTVRNLGQLIQPLVVILMGGLVLFIILAVLLPYIQMLTSLSAG